MTTTVPSRRERRLQEIEARRAGRDRARQRDDQTHQLARLAGFGGVVVSVLAVGSLLAFGDFLDRPAAQVGTIDVQSSMGGFTPSVIKVKAGTTASISWWTDDAAMHLEGGVHTMVAPELGLYEELGAESRRMISWQVPDMPGTYDVYCDSCCGGKESPTMHGTIVIEPGDRA